MVQWKMGPSDGRHLSKYCHFPFPWLWEKEYAPINCLSKCVVFNHVSVDTLAPKSNSAKRLGHPRSSQGMISLLWSKIDWHEVISSYSICSQQSSIGHFVTKQITLFRLPPIPTIPCLTANKTNIRKSLMRSPNSQTLHCWLLHNVSW